MFFLQGSAPDPNIFLKPGLNPDPQHSVLNCTNLPTDYETRQMSYIYMYIYMYMIYIYNIYVKYRGDSGLAFLISFYISWLIRDPYAPLFLFKLAADVNKRVEVVQFSVSVISPV